MAAWQLNMGAGKFCGGCIVYSYVVFCLKINGNFEDRYFDYLANLIPCIVLPISRLPDIAQKTTCTQNVPMNATFYSKCVLAL